MADLERSVVYHTERLGFVCEVHGEPPNFATADCDAETILLALAPKGAKLVPHWQLVEMMWNVYIRVDDVDAIYAEVQKRGTEIDHTIYNAPHGFRELGVTDPDGDDIAFGQRIEG